MGFKKRKPVFDIHITATECCINLEIDDHKYQAKYKQTSTGARSADVDEGFETFADLEVNDDIADTVFYAAEEIVSDACSTMDGLHEALMNPYNPE